ncbi:DUF5047 domain-containing protein [Pseudonocardia sp. D17]|uniref:DUF5047 domain-containing protein n=1 Tax=Pseudonocardia sp. D17 TaxID=882661 RepID=UPI002B387D7D|nr:hypothetical protein PSD17_39200 [Pseudonocardia sp. D17]
MWNISAAARAALRGAHGITGRATAYTPSGGVLADFPIKEASITADAKSQVRRTATLTVADPSMWPSSGFDALSPVGAEIALEYGIVLSTGVEWVPVFRGPVQTASLDMPITDALSVDLSDRSKTVADDRFDVPTQTIAGNTVVQEITRLIRATLPNVEVIDRTGDTTVAAVLDIDKERWQDGIEKLADSIGAEVFADQVGRFVIRPQPTLFDDPAWVVDAGSTGVLVKLERELTRDQVYNAVIASGQRSDGIPPVWAKVTDDDPDSPTRYGGPFGRKPRFYSSPLLTSQDMAEAAAASLLERVRGYVASVEVTAVPNPALEPGDVIEVRLLDGTRQRHILDKVPLTFSPGVQAYTTRSIELPAESG